MADKDIENFLRQREVLQESIERMKYEKIDAEVICSIDDAKLAEYIPLLGDRVALKKYCTTTESKKKGPQRKDLFKMLKQKVLKFEKKDSMLADDQDTSKGARKKTRKIEIGWINDKAQVRKRKGGGTRKIDVDRKAERDDLIREAQELFFPEGHSPLGEINEFDFDILDFKETRLPEGVTVDDCYSLMRMGIVTFYLHTTCKQEVSDMSDCDNEKKLPSYHIVPPDTPDHLSSQRQGVHNFLENLFEDSIKSNVSSEGVQGIVDSSFQAPAEISDFPTYSDDIIQTPYHPGNVLSAVDLDATVLYDYRSYDQNARIDNPDSVNINNEIHDITIRVHRGQIFKELIEYVKTSPINPVRDRVTFKMVNLNGKEEEADDTGGVTRDALTEFWQEFYETSTLGHDYKVPHLRHDFERDDWQAIAQVFVIGWQLQRLYPVRLATSFLKSCLFGHTYSSEETDESLISEYMHYVTKSERNVLETAMNDFPSVDMDELTDICSSHDCRVVINANNARKVIGQIAHKEIVQQPNYVKECFYDVFKSSHLDIDLDMKQEYIPTTKKVLSLLKIQPDNASSPAIHNLKRYIRELDDKMLQNFLRFITGSDILLTDIAGQYNNIQVSLVNIPDENMRRPIAHTCARLLELPKNYETLPELRRAFNYVLQFSDLPMDSI